MKQWGISVFSFLTLLFLLSPSGARADELATVTGYVTDPSGLRIAGAKVQATNVETNVSYSGESNGEGLFRIGSIPTGSYRVVVQKTGFKTTVKQGLELHVQDIVSLNFQLEIGSVAESITVNAETPLVNTESGAVSTVINRNFVESLPLNGRNFNTLLQLTPGVVIAQQPISGGSPGQFSIAGQRTDSNNFSVDGVSANFGVSAGLGSSGTGSAAALSSIGGTSSLVSVDDLQEFRIETSSFAPEFGRQPGGQVMLTTRSGTNTFHGSVFDYFRNDVLDANNWFANQKGQPRAPERHNDFGGVLGGPVWKDKTFFFFSYEGARLRTPQTAVFPVPSEFARTDAEANAPAVAPYLDAFPQPDDKTITQGVYTGQFTGNYSNSSTLDAASLRVDHRFGQRFSLFGRYNYAPSTATSPLSEPNNPQTTKTNTQTTTLGLEMSLNRSISNALRGNYSRQSLRSFFSMTSFGGAVPLDPTLLLGSLSPANNVGSFLTFDNFGFYAVGNSGRNHTAQVNVADDLNVSIARHQLQFGGDYREIFLNTAPSHYSAPYFNDIQTLISSQSAFVNPFLNLPARILSQSLSLYGQDRWKITPRLSITYGLRWELAPAPSALDNTTLASWTNTNDPAAIALAPQGTRLWKTTRGNFAPRVGLAYSLTQKGDFVVRVGGGVFYDLGTGQSAFLASNFPNSASAAFPTGVTLPVADLTPLLPTISLTPPFPFAIGFASDLKLPRSYQWNVALEKSFGDKQVISVTYVGQAGRDLLRVEGLNQPNSNFADFTVFDLTKNSAHSNYHSLQVQYRRPLSTRLQALLSYTRSHALDNASDDTVEALPQSDLVISGANDYSSSSNDVRHSFSGALTYALPSAAKTGPISALTKAWSLSSLVVVRTGFPYNATVIGVGPEGGAVFSRPDAVPGQPFYLYGSQCASVLQAAPWNALLPGQSCPGGKALNPAAFTFPATPRQGTEGRNNIPGFGLTQVDLSIGRRFSFGEKRGLQFRADAFNALNHPNFANPLGGFQFDPRQLASISMLNQGLGGLNPLFQQGGARSLQLSLRFMF